MSARRLPYEDILAGAIREMAFVAEPPHPIWLCQAPSCGRPLRPDYVLLVTTGRVLRFCDTRCIAVGSDDTQKARAMAHHWRREQRGLDR